MEGLGIEPEDSTTASARLCRTVGPALGTSRMLVARAGRVWKGPVRAGLWTLKKGRDYGWILCSDAGGPSMRVGRLSRIAATGVGALVALAALSAGASAGGSSTVPCTQAALVAAINAANSAGGGTVNLAAGCDYALTTADNGENGLPVVTTRISVNGNGATIDGTGVGPGLRGRRPGREPVAAERDDHRRVGRLSAAASRTSAARSR